MPVDHVVGIEAQKMALDIETAAAVQIGAHLVEGGVGQGVAGTGRRLTGCFGLFRSLDGMGCQNADENYQKSGLEVAWGFHELSADYITVNGLN